MQHQLLTVKQVAERLAISVAKVYLLKAKIGYAKLGGAIRFREVDVDLFVAASMVREREQSPACKRPAYKLKHLRMPE